MIVEAPISVGELFDKITILEIKSEKISNTLALENVLLELKLLYEISENFDRSKVSIFVDELKSINKSLWEIEDSKRKFEREQDFGSSFIEAARMVYILNDKRAEVKRKINSATGSTIFEEKLHTK